MANKRYDQFPAGTYNATDIFLQADPTTGELEKIALGDIPSGGPALYIDGTVTNNAAGVLTTLSTFSIPANTLSAIGHFIRLQCYLTSSGLVTTNDLVVNVAGTNINLPTVAGTLQYIVNLTMAYVSSGNSIVYGVSFRNTTALPTGGGLLFAFDPTIANTILIQHNNPTANVMIHRLSFMETYN